jgi:hypothetical protein
MSAGGVATSRAHSAPYAHLTKPRVKWAFLLGIEMAERRMFAKTIIGSDAFLEMPQSTQALYFHLGMRADDDGFVNSPNSIMRLVGCKGDDLKILASKKFIIPFESGIVVIKHWKIHNYIAKDRYSETKYKNEKSSLTLDENGSYTECIHHVDDCETQVRLGEVRLENTQDARVESTEPKKPEFAKAVFEAWAELQVSAYQPANYLNFLNSTWARIRPSFQGIHSDDVLAAIQNFKSIAAAAPGKYWWTRKTSIEKWASEHMEKFLPANFKESDFLIGKPQDTRGGALGDRPDAKTPEEQAAWSKELEDRLKNSEEVEINFAELAQGTELGRRLAQEKNAVL